MRFHAVYITVINVDVKELEKIPAGIRPFGQINENQFSEEWLR